MYPYDKRPFNRPIKLTATGPVISTWPSAARHSMVSGPPSSSSSALRYRQSPADGGDQGGAGGAAAGLGDPGTTLPYAHADMGTVQYLGNFDIGFGWQERVAFQRRAKLFKR